jgi:hypothetical protein
MMRGTGLKDQAVGLCDLAMPVSWREVVVKRIIETAERGVQDPIKLADDAVQFFSANYTDGRVVELTETV